MKNIFVAIGQHHINNFENLIDNNLVEKGERILMAGSGLIYDSSKWDRIVEAGQSLDNKANSAMDQVSAINSKIRSYKKMLAEIQDLKNEAITVYICYIEDVLTNYLFLSFGKNTKAVVVEDGTLNYYDHSLKNISSPKFMLKQGISRAHGIPFKRYKGHSSGAEYDHVIAQYLTLPEYAFISKNARQLPVDQAEINKFSNTLYIIGQESYGTLLGQKFFDSALLEFLDRLKKQDFYKSIEKVYYKPHRNGKQFSDSFFEDIFNDKPTEVIRTEHTSETVYFTKLHSKYIAAFDSSTLINLYSRLNENDRNRVSIYVNPLKNDELVPLFKNLGFHFLN